MRFLGWISLFFWIVGAFGIVKGVGTDDTFLISISAILWIGSNFFEILINRDMIRKLQSDANCTKDEEVKG